MIVQTIRILFTSAGRRVGLIECFRNAAQALGVSPEIHACDMNPGLSAACHMADHSFAVPHCSDEAYPDQLLSYCEENRIDLLVPTIDPELMGLAMRRKDFAANGTFVHVSSPEVIAVVRDKLQTTEVLYRAGVPVPLSGTVDQLRCAPQDWPWPLFIKPSAGSASRGIGILDSITDIAEEYNEKMIVQELLCGDEYTINMYIDAQGRLRSVIPHLRISVRGGEVEKGRTVRSRTFSDIAGQIAGALPGACGVMCFQLIDDINKGPHVFEINARFGGGYPLADHAGGRYAESLLCRVLDREECASDRWRDGTTMIRYDAAIYQG